MKRTLFLALTLFAVSSASATIVHEGGINYITGSETLTADTTFDRAHGHNDGATNVGAYPASGEVTLADGVTWTMANALMIAGKGYGLHQTQSGDGKVVVGKGATINVGNSTASSGAHHVDVGNSQYTCKGELYVNGGTVNVAQFVVGMGRGTGVVEVTDGGQINLSKEGVVGTQLGMFIGYENGGANGNGTLILNKGTLTDTLGQYAFIGCAGDATVQLLNGAAWNSTSAVYVGDVWEGAYGEGSGTDTISISADSSFSCAEMVAYKGSALTNAGALETGSYLFLDAMTMVNSGTVSTDEIDLYDGASLDNTGMLDTAAVVLGEGSKLITGTLLVSGCEEAMKPDHEMATAYATGLVEGAAVELDAEAQVTVGAHVTGGETMQYLYSQDFRALDNAVLEGLELSAEADIVKVANVLGKNISANVTTDEAHDGGTITVALSGSQLVVRVGDNGAGDPTAEDREASAEKVGTLGSYHEEVTETGASVRLHTSATESSVAWEGHYMETLSGETSVVNDTTRISVGSEGVEGTLTVVEESTLQNEGAVSSDHVLVKGTLENNGTVSAATTVAGGAVLKGSGTMAHTELASGATFVVGNSPGAASFTENLIINAGSSIVFSVAGTENAADADHKGWNSNTYSQICMKNGAAVTLSPESSIVIAFGGEELFSAGATLFDETSTHFELVLIAGGMAASDTDLVVLMDNTTFVITDEVLGRPVAEENIIWHLNVTDAAYRIDGDSLVLSGDVHITRAPEPATATLSLLALAALVARRRR